MAILLIFLSWLMGCTCTDDDYTGIHEGPANMHACQGDTVSFRCSSYDEDGTDYLSWRHNGAKVDWRSSERYNVRNKYGDYNLQIRNVTKHDEGVYECVFYNRYIANVGVRRASANAQLTVLSKSESYCVKWSNESVATSSSDRPAGEVILRQLKHTQVLPGETANFTCVVRNDEDDVSEPHVTWEHYYGHLFNGEKYGIYADRYGVNVFQIRNASDKDKGTYRCGARGDRSWDRYLFVHEPTSTKPPQTTVNPQSTFATRPTEKPSQTENTTPTMKGPASADGSRIVTTVTSLADKTVQPAETFESVDGVTGFYLLAVIAAIIVIAFVVLVALAAVRYFTRRKPLARPSTNGTAQINSSGPENAALLGASEVGLVNDPIASAELDPNQITVLRRVASGITSEVSQALLRRGNSERTVAVKKITNGHYDIDDLKNEVRLIASCSHPNVVKFVGQYAEADGKTLYLVTEFMDGPSLNSYLRNVENKPTVGDAFRFTKQIADGMLYLAKQHIIHRDLAARNCMLSKDFLVVKIADFGLSRRSDADYVYVSFRNGQGLQPFRWMAPECFDSDGGTTYSEKSDVWAFGVTLWEVFTRSRPFYGMSQADVRSYIKAGKRLEDPGICPKELRTLMHRCWAQEPGQRPKFVEIKERIAEINRRYGGDAEYTSQQYEMVTAV